MIFFLDRINLSHGITVSKNICITCHNKFDLKAALQWKQKIHSISRNVYTGSRKSATTPWTMRSSKNTVRSIMAATIAHPSPLAIDQLDRLPAELVIEILSQLDILSLTRFRRLNHLAIQFVNSVKQHTTVIKHFLSSCLLWNCTVRPKIYSGLKLNKSHDFTPQK